MDVPFTKKQENDALKLAEHLLKVCTKEDPRTALLALSAVLCQATQSCGLRVKSIFDLLMGMDRKSFENMRKDVSTGATKPGMIITP